MCCHLLSPPLGSWKQSVDLFADHKWYQTMFHQDFLQRAEEGDFALVHGLQDRQTCGEILSFLLKMTPVVFCFSKTSVAVSLCKPPPDYSCLSLFVKSRFCICGLVPTMDVGAWPSCLVPPPAAAPTSAQPSKGYLHRKMCFMYVVEQVSLVRIWFLNYNKSSSTDLQATVDWKTSWGSRKIKEELDVYSR